jgi:hypothetical protein
VVEHKPIDLVQLTELLGDQVIVRLVTVIDLASLSILELLEYDFTRSQINNALQKGVIAIDKTVPSYQEGPTTIDEKSLLVSGDYYFYHFLNSKVKLTELGLYILDVVKGNDTKFGLPGSKGPNEPSSFGPPRPPKLDSSEAELEAFPASAPE